MTALRLNNNKDSLVQGMRLLNSILEVMSQPDAKKLLQEAISMSDDELRASSEARAYVENAAKIRAEIAEERKAADQQIENAKAAVQDAKGAMAASKQNLNDNENRLRVITDRQAKKDSEQIEKDTFLKSESERLNKLSAYLTDQTNQQNAKQKQLDELETKLRGKAAQAAEIMKGM